MSGHRILSVIHGPTFGGAHNQLLRLHGPLRDRGFETIAALPDEAAAVAERIAGAGVEVVRLPLPRLRATRPLRDQARLAAGLRRDTAALRSTIRERGCDLVQVHGVVNPQAGLGAHLERRAAVVWQLLDTRAPIPMRLIAMPFVTGVADAITAWGRALADAHPGANRLGDRLVIVFPPVDPELGPDLEARRASRRFLRVDDSAPLIGTVGVRNPQKGHQHLVRAAAIVKRRRPDAVFRVIGAPSPAHADHMRAVEEIASGLGLRAPDEIGFVDPGHRATELIQALDVFAMTSVRRSEGMPTAILEAMACAKPVVSTDVGAVAELVADGITGRLARPEDPEAIAAALLELLDDPERADRMGAAGRERSRGFGLESLADRHAGAYERALAHRAARRSRR